MLYLRQIVLFQWKRGLTKQLNAYINLLRQQKQQWGSPYAGASLQTYAVEADAVNSAITMEVDNIRTSNRGTTSAITCQMEFLHTDVSMALAALVATMAEAGETENALVLFVALTGTKPSSALKRVKHRCPSLRRFVVPKAMLVL
jgi:hypothetical protein